VQVSQNKKGDLISALRAVAEGVKGGVDSIGANGSEGPYGPCNTLILNKNKEDNPN